MKRRLLIFFILISTMWLSGCSLLTMTFTLPSTSTISTTQPTTVNGTISLGDDSYSTFASYSSPTYDLTDIDAYNDILINTRDLIKRSNVQITTSVYTYVRPYPWSTATVAQITGAAQGSGVIFMQDDTSYYALTNHHVIEGSGDYIEYEVAAFGDETPSAGEVIAYDEALDLAVVKFPKENRTNIHLMDYTTRLYTKFTSGELVIACGNPLSLTNNVTYGAFIRMESISNADFLVIHHDAAIHEGSSGGALVDVDGNLLGLNTWGSETSEDSYAVPVYIIYMFLVNYGII